MKLIKTMVLALAASLMVAACGGGSASTPTGVMQEFFKASKAQDVTKALSFYSKDFPGLEQAKAQFQAAKDMMAKMPAEQKKLAEEMASKIVNSCSNEKIAADGNSATVDVKTSGLPMGASDQTVTYNLKKEDGAWKISGFQVPGMGKAFEAVEEKVDSTANAVADTIKAVVEDVK